ncbi:M23 family metallopeptidase [Aquabacterium sp.]|uniref:M23 family metallopeptidase n=1 Tax=Aquabacterium sp. TaxID=1872578 RepID=UPI0035AF437A
MQILITNSGPGRTRALSFSGWQLAGIGTALGLAMLLLSGVVYHFVLLKAARERWPVVSQIVSFVVRDEFAQRDRYMRENLDAMAQKVGEMQANIVKLEAMGERVSGLAGIKPEEWRDTGAKPATAAPPTTPQKKTAAPGSGGPFVPASIDQVRSADDLTHLLATLDEEVAQQSDVFTLIESRLFEKRLTALMIPSSAPIVGPIGSGFGFRIDPFTHRSALHTGLDFPADVGTPVGAAAGGMVIAAEVHPQYGQMVEIDHGNGLVTRYGHASQLLVKQGDLVKRGQKIALVGTSGRSTGPHLHFEVLVDGVQQNPAKFLAGQIPPESHAVQQAAR